jgi:uncharacterized membrane protein
MTVPAAASRHASTPQLRRYRARMTGEPSGVTQPPSDLPRVRALLQVGICAIVGLLAAIAAGLLGPIWLALLLGWDAAALTYLIWTWFRVGRLNADDTAAHATNEDPTRQGADLLLLFASAASLVAVGVVIVNASDSSGVGRIMQTVIGVGSVIIGWLIVHTTYTLRYARLFHDGHPGGVDFNSDEMPDYRDFAYVAFTIGMTFQVSDTSFTSSAMRATALRHALLSYLYGTVIIATAINLVAGLTK